jgi:hypothetical protein
MIWIAAVAFKAAIRLQLQNLAGGELTDCAYIGAKVDRWLNAALVVSGDGACFSTIAFAAMAVRSSDRP